MSSVGTTFVELLLLICLHVFTTVKGCGVLPSQQGRTVEFEVTGFKLPAAMVYSVDKTAPSMVPNISTSELQAVTFVKNTVIRSIEDVLHQQGRGAGLSDDVISLIFSQIDVTIKYKPLKCDIVFTNPTGAMIVMEKVTNCQIITGTVTKTCSNPTPIPPGAGGVAAVPAQFMCEPAMLEDIKAVHLTITGIITTTNVIMANWSTQMWQSVLNRALRSLTSTSFGAHFLGASITIK